MAGARKTVVPEVAGAICSEEHLRLAAADALGREGRAIVLNCDSQAIDVLSLLRRTNKRYQALVEASTSMVWRASSDGAVIDGGSWEKFSGQDAGDCCGSGWLNAVHPDDRVEAIGNWLACVASGAHFHAEYRVRCRSGAYRWVSARGVPLRSDDGSIEEWVGTVSDIHDRKIADDEIRSSEERLRLCLETSGLGIWDVDLRTGERRWSDQTKRILGLDPDVQPSHELFLEHVHPEDRSCVEHGSVFYSAPFATREYRIVREADKQERTILASCRLLRDEFSVPVRVLGTMQDVTDSKRAEVEVKEGEERLRVALHAGRMIAWSLEVDTGMVSISDKGIGLFGVASNSLSKFIDCVAPCDRDRVRHFLDEANVGPSEPLEFQFTPPNGSPTWLEMRATRPSPNRIIGVTFDIGGRKAAEQRIWHIANHDPLTQLPNRVAFKRRFEEALAHGKAASASVGLLLIDLDDFKDVNDTLGHQAGDAILIEVASRLNRCIGQSGFVARLGGDEFAVVTEIGLHLDQIKALGKSLCNNLRDPISYGGVALASRASVGISIFPHHDTEPADLMKDADIALYRAKALGRGRVVVYSEEMRQIAETRVALGTQIRQALSNGQIVPFYQPKVCLSTGQIVGFESLARWLHPSRGVLTAGDFAAAFEDAELAVMFGQCMIRQVARDIRRWLDRGLNCGRVGVNFAAAEFANPDLADETLALLSERNVPTSNFEVEVTESVFLSKQPGDAAYILKRFHEAGIHISLDDFGTGFASLTHLRRFPVDHVKIDQSFVREIEQGEADAAIVKAVIALGASLNLRVTAEGIETNGQLRKLREMGCMYGQGYLFSKAITGSRVPWLLNNWRPERLNGIFPEAPLQTVAVNLLSRQSPIPANAGPLGTESLVGRSR